MIVMGFVNANKSMYLEMISSNYIFPKSSEVVMQCLIVCRASLATLLVSGMEETLKRVKGVVA